MERTPLPSFGRYGPQHYDGARKYLSSIGVKVVNTWHTMDPTSGQFWLVHENQFMFISNKTRVIELVACCMNSTELVENSRGNALVSLLQRFQREVEADIDLDWD